MSTDDPGRPDDGPPTGDLDPVTEETIPPNAVPDDPPWHQTPPPPPGAPSPGDPSGRDGVPPITDGAITDGAGADGAGADGDSGSHRLRWILLGAAVLLGLLYVGGWYATGLRMPVDTTVGGVQIGGQSPATARETLERELGDRQDDPITLTHEELVFEYLPDDIGLSLDAEASVEEAGGQRSWHPRDIGRLLFGSDDLRPETEVDTELFETAVQGVGEAVNIEVTEALITFPEAQPEPRQPVAGRLVTEAGLLAAVREVYLVDEESAKVPTEVVEPAVDAEGLEQAMTEIAVPAVSAPVLLQVGEQQVELPVSAFAPALQVQVEEGQMVPSIDPELLAGPLTDSTTGIGERAVDATIEIVGGKPVITPGKPGVGLQPDEMATKLLPALTLQGPERVVAIEATAVEPEFTTADAEAMNITEKISEFTTTFPYAEYRNINQSRAAALLDGVLLEPGESFSFNDTVGERTRANGFTSGIVINGGVFREELGGGVSQVVTTLYNAAFFAGLRDDEHHPHAFYIDRYPVGREATVYFGSLDLRFTNDTPHGVLIKSFVNPSRPGANGSTTVQMWSTKVYDIEAGASPRRNFRTPGQRYDTSAACVPQAPIQGFDIDIYRVFKQNGQTVKTETDTAVYQAADAVTCGPPPPPPAE